MKLLHRRRGFVLFLTALLLVPAAARSGSPQAAEPTRVVTGIPSAERLLGDLSWLVGKLADDQKTWDETLQPAAEVFLYGVDPERPLGVDIVLDREGGKRSRFNIPISDLQVFREENLEPIDIQSRRHGGVDYYKLTSDSLKYEAWMRTVDDYASISTKEQDVPAGMPSPKGALDNLLAPKDYDAGMSAHNSADGVADRRDAFQEFRENMLAGITRRPTETVEAYELRKRLASHQSERMERMFVEGQDIVAGWITDSAKEEGRGELELTALPGTELAKVLAKFGMNASYFAAVPTGDDALVHGRMNIPLDQKLQTQADEFYKLVGPVWKQRIDGDAELSETKKAARHKICDLGLEMFHDGRTLEALDACLEISPAEGGTHVLLAGIRTTDGTKAIEILKVIPDALGDLALELNVDQAGDFAIHRFKPTANVPKSLTKFYGDGYEVFVATGTEAVWIAAGNGVLPKLKEAIQLVQEAKAEPNGDVFVGTVRLGPMLEHLDELGKDIKFDPTRFIGKPAGSSDDGDEDSKKKKPGQALMSLDLKELAIPTLLESADDHFSVHVRQNDGAIHADVKVERGVLKAAGKVIAKVAAERLAG